MTRAGAGRRVAEPAVELTRRVEGLRRGRPAARRPRPESTSRSRRASSSAWSAPPAAARRRCSTWSPGSTSRRAAGVDVRRPHRPDVPGGGAVPVADGRRQRRAGPAARRAAPPRAAPPGSTSCCASVHLDGFARQAAARAVGRHAPAGGAGPGARPGRRRAADGRALRRARRHDPRPAPRRARADLARPRPHRRCSSPTTSARRCAWATGCVVLSQPARAGWPHEFVVDIAAAPPHRLARGERAGRDHHRPAARGGASSCSRRPQD